MTPETGAFILISSMAIILLAFPIAFLFEWITQQTLDKWITELREQEQSHEPRHD